MKRLLVLFLSVLNLLGVYARQDSVCISLLTCAPGTEVYELFGHTALRYEDPARKIDWVFNYGVFSFNTPHFVMRFVKGETDYQLGKVPYLYFAAEYAMRGSSVYQQTLNLTVSEKRKIGELLEDNYRPANRVYRYNFFYNNCTTRARDRIEECVDGKIVYPDGKKGVSFRSVVHQYTEGSEWDELGIDLCLGSEADVPIDARKQMFAPFNLLEAARGACIVKGDSIRPLVSDERIVVNAGRVEVSPGFPLSPVECAWILLVVTCGMGWLQLKVGKVFWAWDLILYGAQGVAGCVIAFLVLFSVHPTVGSNRLVFLFNPVPLLYLPVMTWRAIKGRKDLFHLINTICLTLFIMIMPFIQQKINAAVLPLALCLLVCSISHVLLYYRRKQ